MTKGNCDKTSQGGGFYQIFLGYWTDALAGEGSGSFFMPSLLFPRRRESRNVLLKKLDARLARA